jgi:hypothetical protein
MAVLLAGAPRASEGGTPAVPSIAGFQVSFKLDPRLTRGLYMGERWVSPPTYSGVQDGKAFTVEARVQGREARWIPSDPEMVAVSPSQGQEVTITVKRAGQSRLRVASDGVSKELAIKAAYQGTAIRVEIVQ